MLSLPYIEERWVDIDPKGIYQISCFGNTRKLDIKYFKETGVKRYKPKKQTLGTSGHSGYKRYLVSLGRGKYPKVHRLVGEAFVPNPENKPCIDHIDGNPLNNFWLNLRWVTKQENTNNPKTSWKLERTQFKKGEHTGTEHPKARAVYQYTKDGQFIRMYDTIAQAAKELGVSHSNIVGCCNGKHKTCRGYVWSYFKLQ